MADRDLLAGGRSDRRGPGRGAGPPPARPDQPRCAGSPRTPTSTTRPRSPTPRRSWRLRRLIKEFEPDLVHSYGWLTHSIAVGAARQEGAAADLRPRLRERLRGATPWSRKDEHLRRARRRSSASPAPAAPTGSRRAPQRSPASSAPGRCCAARPPRSTASAASSPGRWIASSHVEGARDVVVPNFHEDVSGRPVDEEHSRSPAGGAVRPLRRRLQRRSRGSRSSSRPTRSSTTRHPWSLPGRRAPTRRSEFPAGVTVIEDVPYPTVLAMWERALFGVFPTRIPEALGNVVHEAMSKGRAMIGTRPGGHEDMIEDGVNGLLVPAGDADALSAAMARLLGDAALRERLGAAALRAIARLHAGGRHAPDGAALPPDDRRLPRGALMSKASGTRSRDLTRVQAASLVSLVLMVLPFGGLLKELALVPLALILPGYAISAAMFMPGSITRGERLVVHAEPQRRGGGDRRPGLAAAVRPQPRQSGLSSWWRSCWSPHGSREAGALRRRPTRPNDAPAFRASACRPRWRSSPP